MLTRTFPPSQVAGQLCFRHATAHLVQPHGPSKPNHARQTVGIRMALPTTERLVWHCGDRTAKPESASRGRFLITRICCYLWQVARALIFARGARSQLPASAALGNCIVAGGGLRSSPEAHEKRKGG